eukprot:gene685-242_t
MSHSTASAQHTSATEKVQKPLGNQKSRDITCQQDVLELRLGTQGPIPSEPSFRRASKHRHCPDCSASVPFRFLYLVTCGSVQQAIPQSQNSSSTTGSRMFELPWSPNILGPGSTTEM